LIEQSFTKSLFHGVIPDDMIFPFPEMSADERESTSMLLSNVRRYFGANVDSAKIDREGAIPPSVLSGLRELGLFGLQVPTQYGGAGLSTSAYARIMQEIAGSDASIGGTLRAHQTSG